MHALYVTKLQLLNVSLHLQLYKMFKVPGPGKSMGRGKEWNVDLIPKYFLASGESILFSVCLMYPMHFV